MKQQCITTLATVLLLSFVIFAHIATTLRTAVLEIPEEEAVLLGEFISKDSLQSLRKSRMLRVRSEGRKFVQELEAATSSSTSSSTTTKMATNDVVENDQRDADARR